MPSLHTDAVLRARLWTVCLLVLGMTLTWDALGLDLPAMHGIATVSGFPLRHNWWLERVLHDAMRQAATLAHLWLVAMVFWPLGPMRQLTRWERLSVAVGVSLALLTVNWIKRHSLTSCPWELADFGGAVPYVSHWALNLADGGGGHCFPGGHASAAFAFLGLPLPWLASTNRTKRAAGRRGLLAVAACGMLLGLAQTVRGAHYPSHTLWTAVVCGSVVVLNHELFAAMARWHLHRTARTSVF